MAQINLLPWRQWRRRERNRQFVLTIALAAVASGAAVYASYQFVGGMIQYQERRNELLESEIAKMEDKIEEIEELKETRRRLVNRMKVIEDLQKKRTETVHLFDELVSTVPDGVHLTSLKQQGDSISLKGQAESNSRVSNYMKELDSSDWFSDPQLKIIETTEGEPRRVSEFTLEVKQTPPEPEGSEQGGDGQSGDGNPGSGRQS